MLCNTVSVCVRVYCMCGGGGVVCANLVFMLQSATFVLGYYATGSGQHGHHSS